ncbi:DUF317 domain-containing protein [Streptomyces sp. NPDC093249]|uniref:DUF317 domain-containing protein n=1 Tax=unclassified Streptomyces TaxID=2593676 RepID=UPI00344E98C8
MDSPGGDLMLDFVPGSPDGTWWTIAHHDPFWTITATRNTPLEALAAVTQVLPQLLGDTRHADRIPLTAHSVPEIAELNGWSRKGTSFTSPDGHCTMHHEPDLPWRVEHSVYGGVGTEWSVRTAGELPKALAAQFLSFLSMPDPVERSLDDIPQLARSRARMTSLTGGGGLGPQLLHALGGLLDPPGGGRRR